MTRVDVRASERSEALRCAWCHDALVEDERACAGCGAVHHAECWAEAGACATCRGGCAAHVERPLPWPVVLVGVAGALFVAVIPFQRLVSHAHEAWWAHLTLVVLMTVPFGALACRLALTQLRNARGRADGVDAPAKQV